MRTKVSAPPVDFQPLAPLLESISSGERALEAARLASLDRGKLLDEFGDKFAGGARTPASRASAYLIAERLVKLSIPPCFWRHYLSKPVDDLSAAQQFDLMVYDLLWLRWQYIDHVRVIPYGRYKKLLSFHDPALLSEAEYAFNKGRREAWEIVRSMRLTKAQQWECAWLRSMPIKRIDATTGEMRARVFAAIKDDIDGTRRTKSFTADDAAATLRRRHSIWLCSRMVEKKTPAQITSRYQQLTGEKLSRQIIARQFGIVREILAGTKKESEMEAG